MFSLLQIKFIRLLAWMLKEVACYQKFDFFCVFRNLTSFVCLTILFPALNDEIQIPIANLSSFQSNPF